jgi:sugar phosphate isomerase/epimerase
MTTYGLSTGLFGGIEVSQVLGEVTGAGFEAIEICGSGYWRWFEDAATTRRQIARAGVKVCSAHCPAKGWKLADPDEQARTAAIEATCACLRAVPELGADLVVCHCNAPGGPFAGDDYHQSIARSISSLRIVAAEAARLTVRLAVETMMPRGEKRPAQSVDQILEMIDGLGDHVGICLDTGHSHASGNGLPGEAIAAGEKLFCMHLHDNHGVPDQDEHLIPGAGTIDFDALLDSLDGMGFAGPRTFEIAARNDPTERIDAIRNLAQLRDTWGGR